MITKKNLKDKSIFINNDLIWKDRQIQKEMCMIVKVGKGKEVEDRLQKITS